MGGPTLALTSAIAWFLAGAVAGWLLRTGARASAVQQESVLLGLVAGALATTLAGFPPRLSPFLLLVGVVGGGLRIGKAPHLGKFLLATAISAGLALASDLILAASTLAAFGLVALAVFLPLGSRGTQ